MSSPSPLYASLLLGLLLATTAGCRLPSGGTAEPAATIDASLGAWAEGARLRAAGSPVIQVGGLISDELRSPAIAYDPATNAHMAVWQQKQADAPRVYATMLGANLLFQPVPGSASRRIQLSEAPGAQRSPALSLDALGFITAWEQAGSEPSGVYARRLQRDGTFEGGIFRIGGDGATAPTFADAPVDGLQMVAWQEGGRVLAAPLSAQGPGTALSLAGTAGLFGNWLGTRPEQPVVVAAPTQGRFMIGWREGAQLKARLVNAGGGLGDAVELGSGQAMKLAYDSHERRFLALYEKAGAITGRTLGLDGQLGAETALGQGDGPSVVYDPNKRAFNAVWRSNGYIVQQGFSPSLAPMGPAALMPSANARSLALAYNSRAQLTVLACEEKLFSFERLTLLQTR